MSITWKYSLYILVIFAIILLSIFYIINFKISSVLNETVSNMIENTVWNVSSLMQTNLRFLPDIAVSRESSEIEWLKSDYMYFGGRGKMIEYTYENIDNKWYIIFKGRFETFMINEATVDISKFMEDIVSKNIVLSKGYIYVIDNFGNIVYHTISKRIGINIEKEGLDSLLKSFEEKNSGYVTYEYQGEKIKAFYSRLDFPFDLKYYDSEGNEHKVYFYVVNAMTMDEFKSYYSGLSKFLYRVIIPSALILLFIASYIIAKIGAGQIERQHKIIKEFSNEIYSTITNISTSSAEMEKIAENNAAISKQLSEITHNFSTSVEEGRYEVDNSIKSIKSFLDLLTKVSGEIESSVNLISSLTDLNEKIAYLSDTISVLAINASIESSKENIDREGIAKIVEHITSISKDARETAHQTKKTIEKIQNSLSNLALYSERIKREGDLINSAIGNISKVMSNFISGIREIRTASENIMRSSEDTTVGAEDIVNSLRELRSAMNRLTTMISKLKV